MMGANDAAEMLEVAKAECVRLERRVAELTAALEQSTPHPDNDREALIAVIADRLSWSSLHWEVGTTDMHRAVADALIAAGFGRLPVVETVTTVESASNAKIGTVLLDAQGDIWDRYYAPNGKHAWRSTGDDEPRSSNWIVFPATVLYRPVEDGESNE